MSARCTLCAEHPQRDTCDNSSLGSSLDRSNHKKIQLQGTSGKSRSRFALGKARGCAQRAARNPLAWLDKSRISLARHSGYGRPESSSAPRAMRIGHVREDFVSTNRVYRVAVIPGDGIGKERSEEE